jgi:hypothetical protein
MLGLGVVEVEPLHPWDLDDSVRDDIVEIGIEGAATPSGCKAVRYLA